jgi:hypothetical protein
MPHVNGKIEILRAWTYTVDPTRIHYAIRINGGHVHRRWVLRNTHFGKDLAAFLDSIGYTGPSPRAVDV